MIGGTLAHYKIDAKLGEGGMGVVYRATDTHLDRFVAIKVLRAEAVPNPERRRRFVQEAKAASALNHPNIVTIHDINSWDGVDYIVMEYVQGRSLDQVIETHRLDTQGVLRYAIGIAGALAKAHEIGLVHRDLKPANIMITGDGLVKIVDFGLAKLIEPEESDAGSTTVTMRAGEFGQTAPGTIVGTWAYMSPEQAEGKKIDARSDIFSFGAVLYEMMTGRKAFQRETRVATLLAVVREQPPLLTEGAGSVARELGGIVSQCLQKEPAQRMQHMGDVKIALERVLSESEAPRTAGRPVDSHSPRRRFAGALLAAGVLVVAAAFGAWWLRATRQPGSAPVLTRLTADSGLTAYPALSPDGKLLAYASDRAGGGNLDIWVQQMGGGNPIRLTTDDADDLEPNFSPDGSRMVFRSERDGGGIYAMPALGGIEQRLADLGRDPRFSPDGKWIAYWIGDLSYYGRRRIFVIPAAGGQAREVQPEFFFATHPVWSPDSRYLLFRGAPDANATQVGAFDWWITPISGGTAAKTGAAGVLQSSDVPALERSQLHGGFGVDPGEWLANSVFFSAASGNVGPSAALWRVPMSSSRQVKGPAQRLTSGTTNELQPAVAGARIAFASLAENENLWSLDVDANAGKGSAEPRRLTSSAASDILPAPSADGAKVAFASNRGGNLHVWVKDLKSGAEHAITSTAANELPWLMSPDGSRVLYCVFGSQAAAEKGCFLIPAAGGVARQVCADCPISNIFDWYAGGRQVLYKKGLSADTSLILRDVDSGRETTVFHNPKYNVASARFSPDDRWISFQTVTGPTRRQIFVAPIRNEAVAGNSEWVPITDGSGLDRNAVWSPEGNLLYFLSERDGFRCFWAQRLDGISKRPIGPAFAVHHFHEARRSLMPTEEVSRIGLSVTRDKIIFSMVETSGNIWLARFE